MEESNNKFFRPVCVFDSGIGGLNLLKRCAYVLPHTNFIYFADNYNVPYGELSKEKLTGLVFDIFDEIESLNPQAAVVACNTVTSQCISLLRERYAFPIVGIQPAVKQAAKINGRCLVLATPSTVKSSSFIGLVNAYLPSNVVVYPCAHLADYIEQNIFSLPRSLPQNLLPDIKVDSVVLGCTHYIFAKDIIQEYYRCPIFDGIVGTADHLKLILGNDDHFCESKGKITFKRGDFDKNRRVYELLTNTFKN